MSLIRFGSISVSVIKELESVSFKIHRIRKIFQIYFDQKIHHVRNNSESKYCMAATLKESPHLMVLNSIWMHITNIVIVIKMMVIDYS